MKTGFSLFLILFIGISSVQAQVTLPLVNNPEYKPGWTLSFQDEFDGNLDNWVQRCGWTGGMDVVDANNTYISNGKLVIRADYSPGNYTDCGGQPGTKYFYFKTGYLTSHQTFGPGQYFEIKARLPLGKYFHTGFFTWGCDEANSVIANNRNICGSTQSWNEPCDCLWSEVDIWEHGSCDISKQREFHSNYHSIFYGNNYKYECAGFQNVDNQNPTFNAEWYTVGVYWKSNSIQWYLNNHLVREVTTNVPTVAAPLWLGFSVDKPGSNIAQELLNMVNSSGYDNTMEVEYVRVYEPNCTMTDAVTDFGTQQGFNNQSVRPRTLADVNGDGRQDIVAFAWNYTLVSLANTDGTFSASQYVLQKYTLEQGWTNMETEPRTLADVNDDGKADIIGFTENGTYVSLSTSSGSTAAFTQPQLVLSEYGINQAYNTQEDRPRMVADINGDGKADIIAFAWTYTLVSLSTSTATVPSFTSPQFVLQNFTKEQGWTNMETRPRTIADINGDGKADIVGFGVNYTMACLSTSSGLTASFGPVAYVLTHYTVEQGYSTQEQRPRILSDVNGDGKADIVAFGNTFTAVSLSSSTSSASFMTPQNVLSNFTPQQGWLTQNDYPRAMADINGDGKADIVGFGQGEVKISVSQSTATNASFYEYQN